MHLKGAFLAVLSLAPGLPAAIFPRFPDSKLGLAENEPLYGNHIASWECRHVYNPEIRNPKKFGEDYELNGRDRGVDEAQIRAALKKYNNKAGKVKN